MNDILLKKSIALFSVAVHSINIQEKKELIKLKIINEMSINVSFINFQSVRTLNGLEYISSTKLNYEMRNNLCNVFKSRWHLLKPQMKQLHIQVYYLDENRWTLIQRNHKPIKRISCLSECLVEGGSISSFVHIKELWYLIRYV